MSKSWLRVALAVMCLGGGIVAISKAFAGGDTMLQGTVTKISDGDTIHFQGPNSTRYLTIRVLHIDAPEEHYSNADHVVVGQGPWGQASHAHLEKLIPLGTPLTLKSEGFDKYHRVLGVMYFQGRDVNLKMVRDGWALPYVICSGDDCDASYFERENIAAYLQACDAARSEGLGVFDPSHPLTEEPYIFRVREGRRSLEKFVGDFATKKLYAPNDYKQVDVCRRVFFMTEAEATRAGFNY